MSHLARALLAISFFMFAVASPLSAEEDKPKAEDLVEAPDASQAADLSSLRRTKLTEEQAVNQLKFMMVKGWARVEDELIENNTFKPFGMVLSPQGEFRPVYLAEQEKLDQSVALAAIVKNLEAIAQTRSMWAVGLMYIQGKKRKDGSLDMRIMVLGEHIAGWARHWAYPFKIENGEVKLGAPAETAIEPVYYVPQDQRQ